MCLILHLFCFMFPLSKEEFQNVYVGIGGSKTFPPSFSEWSYFNFAAAQPLLPSSRKHESNPNPGGLELASTRLSHSFACTTSRAFLNPHLQLIQVSCTMRCVIKLEYT